MIILGILVAVLGTSLAVDLTGCRPQQPKVINGLFQLIGDVYSPGYREGQNYPDGVICETQIQAPFGFKIKLEVRSLDIEPYDMCMRDAVEIIEFIGHQPSHLAVLCGNQTHRPLLSQGNVVSILFRSDFMRSGRGFHLHYTISVIQSLCSLGQGVCRNRNCYFIANRCNGQDDCGDGTDEENCPSKPAVTDCGLRNASKFLSYDRIIGGKEAEPGSWPWQADMQIFLVYPNGHMCGGTLITAQWVLTAAHCFQQYRQPGAWRIHLGNHNKFKKDSTEQVRYAQRIILYPGTTGEELFRLPQIDITNDMALIKLNAPVKFTDSVRPACLPNQGYELTEGTKCIASGWGMTRGTGSFQVLKEVELSIQNAEVCNGQMGPINQTTMICVKNAKGFQDVCHGDSGGPLACELNGKWNVMGATSFGTQGNYEGGLCALPGSATVYAKTSHKTNWIRQQINKYG